MVVHWWRLRGARWRTSIVMGAVGCAMSAIVFLIAAITKFTAGAWVSLLIVVAFTIVALLTRRHFDRVDDATALNAPATEDGESEQTPSQVSNLVIVPIPRLDRVRMRALAYAGVAAPAGAGAARERNRRRVKAFPRVLAHVAESRAARARPVSVPCRHPTVRGVCRIPRAQRPELTVTVIVPDLAVRHWWERPLHDDTAARLRHALAPLAKVVVTSVRFHV